MVSAKSEKILFSILELIDFVKNGVKKSTATFFISFGEIVSILVAFLEKLKFVSNIL